MENATAALRDKPLWEYEDPSYTNEWFLVGSNTQFGLFLGAYLAFVLKVGPYLMKDRAPFKLTNILLVYNMVQVVVAAYICKLAVGILYSSAIAKEKCIYDSSLLQYKYFYALHVYLLAKLSELLDTIFFVLRKKDRQVSFLHVYHHSAVFFYSWALMSYRQAFLSVTVIGLLNSFVHLVMYSYYALSVFPSLTKYLWWKKYITKMQMIQFAMMIAYTVYENTTSPCKLPGAVFLHMTGNIALVFALFVDFYRKTYRTPQQAKVK